MYTSKDLVEKYLGVSLSADLTDILNNNWIPAVQDWIDKYVGFSFENESDTATAKYFDGSGDRELLIDTYYELSSVVTLDVDGDDDVTIDTDGIIQYPLNRTAKDRLYLESSASVAKWPSHRNAVKITAKWGFAEEVPEDVELAATRLLGHLLTKRLKGGEPKSETLGDYSISYAEVDEAAYLLGVTNILDQYRPLEI